jgi:hypothetical protein
MNQENTADVLQYDENNKPKLPSGLNVLTILTFIGCAVFGLLTLLTPVINKFLSNFMDKAVNSGKELTAKQLEDIEKGRTALLCFIGALWMRKFKKDGYWMYVSGELAPVLGSFLIMGTGQFTSIWSVIFGVGIPLLFVILYTMQRKYLVN